MDEDELTALEDRIDEFWDTVMGDPAELAEKENDTGLRLEFTDVRLIADCVSFPRENDGIYEGYVIPDAGNEVNIMDFLSIQDVAEIINYDRPKAFEPLTFQTITPTPKTGTLVLSYGSTADDDEMVHLMDAMFYTVRQGWWVEDDLPIEPSMKNYLKEAIKEYLQEEIDGYQPVDNDFRKEQVADLNKQIKSLDHVKVTLHYNWLADAYFKLYDTLNGNTVVDEGWMGDGYGYSYY